MLHCLVTTFVTSTILSAERAMFPVMVASQIFTCIDTPDSS